MENHSAVIFIHGFIGTLDVSDWNTRYESPDLLGYGNHRAVPMQEISLAAQVEHLHSFIIEHFDEAPVDVVGHSVGGAIAMLLAHAYPECVRRIVNIEGNFTLDDAFWSASVGRMSATDAEAMLAGFRADPLTWIRGAVNEPTPEMTRSATRWLEHQPASTLRAMGQSVVATTGSPDYPAALREVFGRHPVYLIAGQRSRNGWNAPDYAWEECAGYEVIENSGHLMMLEQPTAFAEALKSCLADEIVGDLWYERK
ncbi:alpha/beta fold hydrolase [Caballeronia sordidicola]|uniref:Esterase protein n=1 Tax=Caballeronia sordidicola TaxID=196367 RepID=A0A226WTH2_CABSO|nr:alpha/beta hydrolase [Caballeronia sordidicola]OXC74471.1 Esterase protein [Caballeronia sordidicola]